jgi:protein TonB
MSTFLAEISAHLPFNKSERIIIGLVIALHLLFLVGLQSGTELDNEDNLDETRVMANLLSPEPEKQPQAAPTPPPPKPKPKQEQKKKTVDESATQAPSTAQNQQQTPAPPVPQSKSEFQAPDVTVAPSTTSGSSGTPIQTDIGKLVVVYQPDADAYYPSFSKRSGEQGEVVVRLIIDELGNVEDVTLTRSSIFPRLNRAATEIGSRYRFKPFLVNGAPAKISTNLLIKFNLKN